MEQVPPTASRDAIYILVIVVLGFVAIVSSIGWACNAFPRRIRCFIEDVIRDTGEGRYRHNSLQGPKGGGFRPGRLGGGHTAAAAGASNLNGIRVDMGDGYAPGPNTRTNLLSQGMPFESFTRMAGTGRTARAFQARNPRGRGMRPTSEPFNLE